MSPKIDYNQPSMLYADVVNCDIISMSSKSEKDKVEDSVQSKEDKASDGGQSEEDGADDKSNDGVDIVDEEHIFDEVKVNMNGFKFDCKG
nr:hypothetical protein [Tanacetum cinerariifolium]